MIIRKKILPKTTSDACSMLFLLIVIPLFYWFQLWVISPEFYSVNSFAYYFNFFISNFLMLNIVGNLTYSVLCDTSTAHIMMPPVSKTTSKAAQEQGWHLCGICEAMSPPRSWHCPTCKTCILKRDHHCIFTGCCVGNNNHRYFLMFLFYFFLGALYAFCHNSIFVWTHVTVTPLTFIKLIFPFAMVIFGVDWSNQQFYLLLFVVNLVGVLYIAVLCYYHFRLVLNGTVADESNKCNYTYDLGWRENLKVALGEKWHLAWTLPYITSPLPSNGIDWTTATSFKSESHKNR